MVKERMVGYKKSPQNTVPKRIIYYRNGVGDGQHADVYEKEVRMIRNAYKAVEAGDDQMSMGGQRKKNKLQVTAIIAAKRHHVRFFPREESQMAKPVMRRMEASIVPQARSLKLVSRHHSTLTFTFNRIML